VFPNQLRGILKRHWLDPELRKTSIYIEGGSGIGKSEIMHDLRAEFGCGLRDKRLSQMDAVDLSGTPWRSGTGFTQWAPPDWLEFEEGSEGILFMDEITSASREVFAASYQLFLDRQVNGARVPDGWMIVAAGNRVSDRGVINLMPSPLMNRFIKLTCEPHLDSWRDWAGRRSVDARMIAWVSYQPEYLHNFTAETAQLNEPFCTPRSIVRAARYLDWEPAERVEMLNGCLGKPGASALESYLRLYTRLPPLQDILDNPLHCRIPAEAELGERYAVSMMCSAKMDRTTFAPLWQYVDRIGGQFIVLAVRLAMQRDISISTARGYRDFTSKHSAIFER
jgi:MoxR-like ATPase